MAWSNNLVFDFWDFYEGENLLWNAGHIHHKKKQKVKDAWLRIAGVLNMHVDEIRSKKNSLMATYRRQRKMKEDSIRSGVSESDVFEPQWFAYSRMDAFLRGVDDFGETLDSLRNDYQKRSASAAQPSVASFEPEVVIKEEPIDIDDNPVPSTSRTDQEFILPCADSFQSDTTPTVSETYTVVKTEPVDEDEPPTTSNGNTTKARKRKAADVGQCESPANRPDEDSATKNSNAAKDHFDVYGEYIAAKLRKLDWKSCAYVQKAFGDILFDAEMGKFK